MSFVSHLECSITGERYQRGLIHGLSAAGRPLLVRYDLEKLARDLTKEALAKRTEGFWRYREFLPVEKEENRISLGEVVTPLIRAPKIEKRLGGGEVLIKDEGRLPTGSFKARGLALAVAMAKELGLHHLAMPTNGNAGAALAAYASRAGKPTFDLALVGFDPADPGDLTAKSWLHETGGDVANVKLAPYGPDSLLLSWSENGEHSFMVLDQDAEPQGDPVVLDVRAEPLDDFQTLPGGDVLWAYADDGGAALAVARIAWCE